METESARRSQILLDGAKLLEEGRQFRRAIELLSQFPRYFGGTAPASCVRKTVESLAQAESDYCREQVGAVQEYIRFAKYSKARDALDHIRTVCSDSAIAASVQLAECSIALEQLTPLLERAAIQSRAWSLIGEMHLLDARVVLEDALADPQHAEAMNELKQDLAELALIEDALEEADRGAMFILEWRQPIRLASLGCEVTIERAGLTLSWLRADGVQGTLELRTLPPADIIALGTRTAGEVPVARHLKAGLLHYAAIRSGRDPEANMASAQAELTQALASGDSRAKRHLPELGE